MVPVPHLRPPSQSPVSTAPVDARVMVPLPLRSSRRHSLVYVSPFGHTAVPLPVAVPSLAAMSPWYAIPPASFFSPCGSWGHGVVVVGLLWLLRVVVVTAAASHECPAISF
eukprot:TRINITY_DN1521_c0_g7_i3.p3 TRINITY_DN1521_c0_g7~~TRINITY_DN1521_c0_g7_i3.p3  ORF type:complete len:111 (+),score=22.46 TRINITY_DN1521_c0_g7_i3:372-704(+)